MPLAVNCATTGTHITTKKIFLHICVKISVLINMYHCCVKIKF